MKYNLLGYITIVFSFCFLSCGKSPQESAIALSEELDSDENNSQSAYAYLETVVHSSSQTLFDYHQETILTKTSSLKISNDVGIETESHTMSFASLTSGLRFPSSEDNIATDRLQQMRNIKDKLPEPNFNTELKSLKPDVYSHVNVMPSFPGGEEQLIEWLKTNLEYPKRAQDDKIEGRVLVRFIVYADGSIGDVQLRRGVEPVLDKEALRVINSMPKWIPGKLDKKPVSVWCTLPITFRLE